jgi:NAD(P)-dependent dehydrogenase (short-subunit alcohol dehydrogenase family)
VLLYVTQHAYAKYEEYVRGNECDTTLQLDGKVYFVTGCNTGIGYQTVQELVKMGATVVMACRTPSKAIQAREEILRRCGAKVSPTKLIVLELDLNSFASVRSCVDAFKQLKFPLHGLINNAGLMTAERMVTPDGLEMVMTANHLSHFLLTGLLLPELNSTAHRELEAVRLRKAEAAKKRETNAGNGSLANKKDATATASTAVPVASSTGDDAHTQASSEPTQAEIEACYGRVVNLASALHKAAPAFNFEDIMSEKSYSLFGTYAQSKLANVLFTDELQRRIDLKSADKHIDKQILVVTHSVHPGCVRTEVTRNMSRLVQLGNDLSAPLMAWLQKTPQEGCFSSVHVATSPEAVAASKDGKRGGMYYFHCEPCEVGPGVNAVDAAKLWAVSEAYVEEKFL